MSELSDSTQQSAAGKRSASPDPGRASPSAKAARAAVGSGALAPSGQGVENSDTAGRKETKESGETPTHGENGSAPITTSNTTSLSESGDAHPSTSSSSGVGPCTSSSSSGDAHPQTLGEAGNGKRVTGPSHSAPPEQSDWAAMAAAEALASLTRGGEDERTEQAHTSKQAGFRKKNLRKSSKRDSPVARECEQSPTPGKSQHTQAAAADSSTSSPEGGAVDSADGQRLGMMLDREEEEEGDDFLSGFSSTHCSSSPSEEETEDAECAIVSVKMAAETRQSVAVLAQVQVRLEALERKAARLHQRLELKLSQQRRPHLEQRSAIIRTIPGFWVTALLNHPLLSAHIDESDEEALSSMSHLEVESLKNLRTGYKIAFHFNRNSYFQNTTIAKEFHVRLGGSMVSFSNSILWHRGQNLTSEGGSGKESGSFFCWFSDHSDPGHDQIAEILKDDLYRNPLRYYLTPLWEPRENGSGHRGMEHSTGSECVVISDSEEDEDEGGACRDEEEEADTGSGDSEDGDQQEDDSSDREKEEEGEEELDVEELDEEQESSSPEEKGQEEES
ncbi:hypothetical protein SKAU_G00101780 [Synaphobranchus kaupii]|uniref:Uncharacterized protein n=1 Tax=Synaphobranchus kaupii TaxID=118154 RepID=A0A9Q1FZL5_SYNKA|nr:hypothetical protein SKAU_G00101780 [Synaphobranchus kaupii]